ncbi:hypothetical protein AC622_10235 [Bacillus sp. FJAT-27916]|uniref:DUF6440 family protein n=1 Tax=Bacillus sp. FJAT-27916 TaxID=1679169 RepID=UPI0006716B28|nr:DUF6440 family protein [Bacillus sp. FJAT-27916]KMY44577.1 hypothetical protein AC622_10235 [Bacillus sp. FJAT-27916]
MANKRFEDVYTQGKMEVTKIIRDNETGVLYMFHYGGPTSGLTVMVDKDGKPLVDKDFIPESKTSVE